jgi:hypothetical protein
MKRLSRVERGFAVLVALMSVLIISAIGVALVLATSTEAMIARNFRESLAALYAADAIGNRALSDLAVEADWNAVLGGAAQSTFFDGGAGERRLADGSTIDLAAILNSSNCGRTGACTSADMNRTTVERPWGLNNPRWRVYASGSLADLLGTAPSTTRNYVLVLVADDPSETDGDPSVDAAEPGSPGRGVLQLQGVSFGPGGSHASIRWTVARDEDDSRVRVVSWRIQM